MDEFVMNLGGRIASGLLDNLLSSFTGIALVAVAFMLMIYKPAMKIYKMSKGLAAGLLVLIVVAVVYRPSLPHRDTTPPAPRSSILPVVDIGPLVEPVDHPKPGGMLDTLKKKVASFFPPKEPAHQPTRPSPEVGKKVEFVMPPAIPEQKAGRLIEMAKPELPIITGWTNCPKCSKSIPTTKGYKYAYCNTCVHCFDPVTKAEGKFTDEIIPGAPYQAVCEHCGKEYTTYLFSIVVRQCKLCNVPMNLVDGVNEYYRRYGMDAGWPYKVHYSPDGMSVIGGH